jgi:hypothetical protein
MKLIKLSCRYVVLLVALLTVCSGLAVCGARGIGEIYTVKLNGVPFRNDVAEGILLDIKSDYKQKGMEVYDNTQKTNVLLAKIERNTDIRIEVSKLLSKLADLYKNRFDKDMVTWRNTTKMSCLHNEMKAADICIDRDDDRISSYLFY